MRKRVRPRAKIRMETMRKIQSAVITGATGAIGNALCRLLAEKHVNLYAIVRLGSARNAALRAIPGVEQIELDVSQLAQLPKKMSGRSADAFFHLAWEKTVGAGRNDMDAQIRNVQHTLDAVRAAAALGCSVFLGAGSQAEYGRTDRPLASCTPCFPETGYGMAKLCAGQMSRVECEKLGLDHVWARILSVYGPYDGMTSMVMGTIEKLLKREKPPLTAGAQLWDFLYADDAANALYRMACSGKPGAVYPVGSGCTRPLREYIQTIRDLIDPALPLGFGEIPYGEKQLMHLEADLSALRADTGFEPRTDFKTGIQNTIEYVRRKNDG